MRIDLSGQRFEELGDSNPVSGAVGAALLSDGAVRLPIPGDTPDILLLSAPLLPSAQVEAAFLIAQATLVGERMAEQGHGRIAVLMSAMGAIPIRRHPAFSMQSAALLAGTRTLAMRLGPRVLVNAVGVGLIGDPPMSGDLAMQGHAALGRPGTTQEVAAAVRLLCNPRNTYMTGQILMADGGWSTGYGRNF